MKRAAWLLLAGSASAGCLADVYIDGSRRTGRAIPVSDVDVALPAAAPAFGPVVRQDDPPPPISGGTLAVTDDGQYAVAADPDRDRIYVVRLSDGTVRAVPLALHDEPGRVAIQGSDRAYVALRRGGAVVAIDVVEAAVRWRVPACSMPRGVAWDAANSVVRVACAGGELVTVPADGSPPSTRREALNDLRDIVVSAQGLIVSTFRRGEITRLKADAGVEPLARPSVPAGFGKRTIAWRTLSARAAKAPEAEELITVAQIAGDTVVSQPAEYYASSVGIGPGSVITTDRTNIHVPDAVLPVDAAVSDHEIALVSAGNGHTPSLPQVLLVDRLMDDHGKSFVEGFPTPVYLPGQITSVAFTPTAKLIALSREPARLFIVDPATQAIDKSVELSDVSREDTGHAIFHTNTGIGVACASCHAEGRDDGRSWISIELGARRTPSLVGTVAGTAPYHWNGEAADLRALANLTFSSRMRGPSLQTQEVGALESWLVKLPPLVSSPPRDVDAATRGKTVFESATGKCSTCHAGERRTNNATLDVGTRGRFQVPSLIGVGLRAPYLHDGSAATLPTLLARPHGGAFVSEGEAPDLVVFLESL